MTINQNANHEDLQPIAGTELLAETPRDTSKIEEQTPTSERLAPALESNLPEAPERRCPAESDEWPDRSDECSRGSGRRVPLRLSDALRNEGIDERKVAESFAEVLGKLSEDRIEESSAQPKLEKEKLLVHVLKECAKVLEPRPGSRGSEGGARVIQIVHNVPRPVRKTASENPEAGGEGPGEPQT
jgi:hypothetical protein